jgi:2-dehydro-3-deoxyphosphogluconate aldolase/(4S)-4-hydroxy-2-oxoglutarate aldolase
LPCVLAVGGSWMAPPDAIGAADWGRVQALTQQAVAQVTAARPEAGL